jgi:hypothetical protein
VKTGGFIAVEEMRNVEMEDKVCGTARFRIVW